MIQGHDYAAPAVPPDQWYLDPRAAWIGAGMDWRRGLLWVYVGGQNPDDRNLDVVPEQLCPTRGCPICGAAYTGLCAVAVTPHAPTAAVLCPRTAAPLLRVAYLKNDALVHAVRLECHGGHRVDFDGAELRMAPVLWEAVAVLATEAYALVKG